MATRAQRRRTEAAAAGKERRKKILAVVGAIVLAVLLVIQGPKLLDAFSSDPVALTPAPPPTTTAPVAPDKPSPQAARLLRSTPTVDPFASRRLVSSEPQPVPILGPNGERDPFMPARAALVIAPERIVIGTPRAGRTPAIGYIVVLASIRTGAGRAVAERIARSARQGGLAQVGVLNSSTRRPLRAGYYVAYAGPYKSAAAVRGAASRARALGYTSAYIRELVRYG